LASASSSSFEHHAKRSLATHHTVVSFCGTLERMCFYQSSMPVISLNLSVSLGVDGRTTSQPWILALHDHSRHGRLNRLSENTNDHKLT
jgi:hypothetical protein